MPPSESADPVTIGMHKAAPGSEAAALAWAYERARAHVDRLDECLRGAASVDSGEVAEDVDAKLVAMVRQMRPHLERVRADLRGTRDHLRRMMQAAPGYAGPR